MFRRLFLGALSRATYSVINIVVMLFLTPFLIHALGTGTYGIVVLMGVFTAQGFGGLADLGFASAVTKYCAQYAAGGEEDELDRLLGTSFWLYVFIGLGTALLVWLFGRLALDHLFTIAPADRPLAGTLLIILAAGTAVDFAALWLAAVLDGFQRYSVGNGIQIGRLALMATLVVSGVRAGYGAVGWVTALVAATAITGAVSYLYLKRISRWALSRARFDRTMVRTLWSFSSKVFVTRLTSVAYHTIDRVALGTFRNTAALAAYDVCNKIHTASVIPLGFTSTLTVPTVSSLDATGRAEDVREFFLRGTLYTAGISLPIVVVLMALAPHILAVWIGQGFEQYATEARVFLSYVLLWSLTPVGWNTMIGLNRTGELLPVNILSVVLNLVISVALVGSMGVLGVILGTVIGNLVAVPLYLRSFLGALGITFKHFVGRVILRAYPQALAVGLALWLLLRGWQPDSVIELGLAASAAALAYVLLFWLTGVDAADKRRFSALLGRRTPPPVTP